MSNERLCPCRFQIPLVLNDGSEIPPETLIKFHQTLRRQFGAYTMLGVRDGVWGGKTEPSQWIEVAIPLSRVPELREVVYAIGKELGQEAMYFDAPPPTVEIVPIKEDDTQGEASAEEGS